MTVFLCVACGTSYPAAEEPPEHCPVCEDERQFVPVAGQYWIAREALAEIHGSVQRVSGSHVAAALKLDRIGRRILVFR